MLPGLCVAGPAASAVLPHHNFYPFTFFFRLTEQQLSCLYSSPPQSCSTSRIKLSSFIMSFSPRQHFPRRKRNFWDFAFKRLCY